MSSLQQPNGINPAGAAPSVPGGALKIPNIPIGPTALASIGTNSTDAIKLWITDIWIPVNRFVTKVGVLQGGTATTDRIAALIYDSQGNLIASCSSGSGGGVALNSSANTFIEMSMVLDGAGATITGVQLYGPGQYYIAVQGNGTTAGALQTIKTATYIDRCCGSVTAGTYGTFPATITVPTSFTQDLGPIVYVL